MAFRLKLPSDAAGNRRVRRFCMRGAHFARRRAAWRLQKGRRAAFLRDAGNDEPPRRRTLALKMRFAALADCEESGAGAHRAAAESAFDRGGRSAVSWPDASDGGLIPFAAFARCDSCVLGGERRTGFTRRRVPAALLNPHSVSCEGTLFVRRFGRT